jgi:branched-chain amino acid transport system substrate-binding protein
MRRWRISIALLVALTMVGAACGNSDDDGDSASGGADDTETEGGGGATDVGVTDTSIKIGQVVTKTGSAATAHADFDKGFEAYIESLNDDGGIHGRKIEVLDPKDDGGTVERNAQEVQSTFEQQQVFTVVGCFPQFGAMPYVRDNKLPLIGCNHDAPTWEKTEHALGTTGNWLDTTPDDDPPARISPSTFYVMGKLGVTKLGVFSYNHPGSRAGSETICDEAPKYGIECVFEDYTLAFGFTDLGATTDKFKSSGAEFAYGAMDAAGGLTIVRSLKRAGLNTPTMWAVLPNVEEAKASSDLIGDLYGVQAAPPFDSDEPAMVEMRETVQSRKPGTEMSNAVTQGWRAAKLFEAGLREAGPNLTRQSFYSAIRGMDAYADPFGLTIDFTKSPEEKIRENVPLDP